VSISGIPLSTNKHYKKHGNHKDREITYLVEPRDLKVLSAVFVSFRMIIRDITDDVLKYVSMNFCVPASTKLVLVLRHTDM
jgi:hypothetical protein